MFRAKTSHTATQWRILLAVLCVVLVVVSGTLSVAHTHRDDVVHSDCGLCTSAHLTVQAEIAVTQIPIAVVFGRMDDADTVSRPKTRLPEFALFTRPPPIDPSLA